MKKPHIPEHTDSSFGRCVKQVLDILTGRRENKLEPLYLNLRTAAGANPTKAEYDALCADVVETREKLNALIARFDE
jgi:hypothetical protein